MFARFDVIATLLDDVSVMKKFATRKTADMLGDGLARGELLVHGTSTLMALPGKCRQLSVATFLRA